LEEPYRTNPAVYVVAGRWDCICRRNKFCAHSTLIERLLVGWSSDATTLWVPGAFRLRVLTSNPRGEKIEIGVCKRQINEVLHFVFRKLDRNCSIVGLWWGYRLSGQFESESMIVRGAEIFLSCGGYCDAIIDHSSSNAPGKSLILERSVVVV
jgi:hypothetical protein